MELMALVAVAFSVLGWMGPFAGLQRVVLLPAPELSTSTPFRTLHKGEWVWLDCKVPPGQRGLRFYLYQQKGNNQWNTYEEKRTNHFEISTKNLKSKEVFTCSYKEEDNSGSSESQRSAQVVFSVIEQPPAPTLSVDPQSPFFTLGEEVTLNCSAPEGQDVAIYRFYKEEQGQDFHQLFREGKGPHEVFHVGEKAGGNYSCLYLILSHEGREFESLRSDTIPIDVRGPPFAPVLKVDPPSGFLQEGETLLLNCSSTGNHTEKIFHFYKDGAEMNSPNQGSQKSSRGARDASSVVSLSNSLQAQPNHTGEFACRYEERMDSRWIMSLWSNKVNITVFSSTQNSSTAWLALLFLIPLMFLFICCYRRKNCVPKSQQECGPGGNRENREKLQMLESKAPTDGDLQGSEVVYAHLTFHSASTYSGPVMESGVPLVKEKGVTYSEILFRPVNRAAK